MRIPVSTYRLQLRSGVDLATARQRLDHLVQLGITDLYLSPIFEAEPGSTHGYDVVSHERIDPAIGGEDGLRDLARAARERGIGIVIDWVPNHMSVASHRNVAWNELLTHGRATPLAASFDIDWHPPRVGLEGRVLLPILGDAYGHVLERGELRIARDGGTLHLAYWERRLPLAPATLAPLVAHAVERLPAGDRRREPLDAVARQLGSLPGPREAREVDLARVEAARSVSARLATMIAADPEIASAIDGAIETWNGPPGDAATVEPLHALISEQAYRPSAWRLALESINYRRFFDVDHLAALRMEDPVVFEAAHRTLLALVADGTITGIRLDHTDGLADPTAYLDALQEAVARALGRSRDARGRAMWIVAEKILAADEKLPRGWAIHGTTGYDFTRLATGVLVDPRALPSLSTFYTRFTGDRRGFAGHAHRAKLGVVRTTFASEVRALADRLERIASDDRAYCDLTPSALTAALEETIAAFPVYRSYVPTDGSRERDDSARIARALRTARRRSPERVADAFDFLEAVLTAAPLDVADPRSEFVLRFQQLTGPVTAKSIEDTAFYRDVRFLAANEVGSDPARPAVSLDELHRANAERAQLWAASMLATSTHDTKRGEDGRARLAVLSEVPRDFRRAVSRWARRARAKRTALDDERAAPTRRDEYLFYQSLIGAWPFADEVDLGELRERMVAFFEKALREAKQSTSWLRPDREYEDASRAFVERMLDDARFTHDVGAFCAHIRDAAVSNALAQVVLRIASPGVPDLYRGAELWNTSLVDPDNRRPIDLDRIHRTLTDLLRAGDPGATARALLADPGDGRIKLWVTHRALRARRDARDLYLDGRYEPLEGGEHCVAFARIDERAAHVASATRLPWTLAHGRAPIARAWGDQRLRGTALHDGDHWRDVLTDREHIVKNGLALRDVHALLPCALLVRA